MMQSRVQRICMVTRRLIYENMKLTSDKVHMNLDKSTVRATGTVDSTAEGGIKGKPVFTMGKDEI